MSSRVAAEPVLGMRSQAGKPEHRVKIRPALPGRIGTHWTQAGGSGGGAGLQAYPAIHNIPTAYLLPKGTPHLARRDCQWVQEERALV